LLQRLDRARSFWVGSTSIRGGRPSR
jgi:hypothetical protein